MENQTNQQPTNITIQTQTSDRYEHISAWGYFGYQILFAIPIVGTIFLIVFALCAHNLNLRSFARSYFCQYLIIGVILLFLVAVGGSLLSGILDNLTEIIESLGAVK
ncbi:MAG: hypothetical protein J6V68_03460 [Clostridia bacterium]|nr:hypothetical protein [Clostridia bacterium]